jgi:micrococcal nuclease
MPPDAKAPARGGAGAPLAAGAADVLRSLRLEGSGRVRMLDARVREAVDGDTAVLDGGDRVRYLGIDAPESGNALYQAAREANRRFVSGRRVVLAIPREEPRDRFGRSLAAVFVLDDAGAEPRLVNADLVASGLARVYLKASDFLSEELRPILVEAQNRALDARRGLWAAAAESGDGAVLVTRDRFHRPDCVHIRGRDGVRLGREAALRSGRSPCRTCNP